MSLLQDSHFVVGLSFVGFFGLLSYPGVPQLIRRALHPHGEDFEPGNRILDPLAGGLNQKVDGLPLPHSVLDRRGDEDGGAHLDLALAVLQGWDAPLVAPFYGELVALDEDLCALVGSLAVLGVS